MPSFAPVDNLKMTTYCFSSCIVSNEELLSFFTLLLFMRYFHFLKASGLYLFVFRFQQFENNVSGFFFSFFFFLQSSWGPWICLIYFTVSEKFSSEISLCPSSLGILLTCILEAVCCYSTPEITYIICMCILYTI